MEREGSTCVILNGSNISTLHNIYNTIRNFIILPFLELLLFLFVIFMNKSFYEKRQIAFFRNTYMNVLQDLAHLFFVFVARYFCLLFSGCWLLVPKRYIVKEVEKLKYYTK